MAWETIVNGIQITSLTTTLTAVQVTGPVDMKVDLEPAEIAHLEVRGNTSGSTDHLIVTVWASALDSPGAVPDSGQTLAGSDWSLYRRFRIVASRDNEWVVFPIRGIRNFAVSVQGTGATDSWTVDTRYRVGVP